MNIACIQVEFEMLRERKMNRSTNKMCDGSNGFLDAVDRDPAKESMHEFKVRFSAIDKMFLVTLVQDNINVISMLSHVLPIVSDVGAEVQGSQIKRCIKGSPLQENSSLRQEGLHAQHWRSKGCGVKSGLQHQ
jgi:hypothetical protein